MTDTLLFLHVVAAFLTMATVVMLGAVALGATAPARTVALGEQLWTVGGFGTLILGIVLAVDIENYDLLDGWILAAIVLWAVAAAAGFRARDALEEGSGRFATWHWVRSAAVVLLLADMIFKPGVAA